MDSNVRKRKYADNTISDFDNRGGASDNSGASAKRPVLFVWKTFRRDSGLHSQMAKEPTFENEAFI